MSSEVDADRTSRERLAAAFAVGQAARERRRKQLDERTDWNAIVHCPECVRTTESDNPEEAVERHNERQHDGEEVAGHGKEFINEVEKNDGQIKSIAKVVLG